MAVIQWLPTSVVTCRRNSEHLVLEFGADTIFLLYENDIHCRLQICVHLWLCKQVTNGRNCC